MSKWALRYRLAGRELASAQFCGVDRAFTSAAEFGIGFNSGLETKGF